MIFRNLRSCKYAALALVFLYMWPATSCNREKSNKTPPAPAGGVTVGTPTAQTSQLTPAYLDELLAPIALYPDVVLIQILTAATNPQEVLDAGNWLVQNTGLSNDQRIQKAKQLGFGPSVQALVQFPEVIDMMCREMDWTKQLGEAFKTDQKSVLVSAQRLRAQAMQAGSLQSTPQQTVKKENQGGQQVVVVQPANPQVVYVPQYDPQKVYAPPQQVQSTEEKSSGVSTGTAVMTSLLSFGVGVALGSALHHDDYYYPNWGYGAAFYGPRPYVPAAYAYRPAYGPAFRPAYNYAAPARYPYAYNRSYGRNNVVVNQNNYYNRFHNNQNLGANRNANINRSTYSGGVANTRPANRGTQDWRGQSTYAGANRSPARNQSLATNRSQYQTGTRADSVAASRAGNSANALAGRTATSQQAFSRPASTQPQVSRSSIPSQSSADRGYGASQQRAASSSVGDTAFSGGSARGERAASARGRQSAGGGSRRAGGRGRG